MVKQINDMIVLSSDYWAASHLRLWHHWIQSKHSTTSKSFDFSNLDKSESDPVTFNKNYCIETVDLLTDDDKGISIKLRVWL